MTTITAIDQEYFDWLVDQIRVPNGKTYRDLFERMHNLEFIWTVPNDNNRIQDGLDLRNELIDPRVEHLNLYGATFLEVLVALSRRLAFQAGSSSQAPQYAWVLIRNLRLHKASDPIGPGRAQDVDEKLQAVIWRTYREDGQGGFFPLQNPAQDQREVEIWYQMNSYVLEMSDI